MNRIAEEITEFLAFMGIPPAEQQPDYRLEIAYRMGYEHALRNYATWKNGEQFVGSLQRPLKTVLAEFVNEEIPVSY